MDVHVATEEEAAASPVLWRSARKRRAVSVEPPYARKTGIKQKMSTLRWTPPPQTSGSGSMKAEKPRPPTLVLGTNATPGPSSFPFSPVNPIPVVAATPDAMDVSVPVTETTLVNHLAAMENNRLGIKMDRTEVKVDKNTEDLKELKERVGRNEAGLDDRVVRVVCGLSPRELWASLDRALLHQSTSTRTLASSSASRTPPARPTEENDSSLKPGGLSGSGRFRALISREASKLFYRIS